MDFIYLDCFSGISGDMLIGALLDGGASFDFLQESIAALKIDAQLSCSKTVMNGINSTSFKVSNPGCPPLRHLTQIEEIIEVSPLPSRIKEESRAVFTRLAEAEAMVHGVELSKIHFHEIGAVDTLVDIVGTFLCLNHLAIDQVYASPLPWSPGFIDISHGHYPLPAPATANLLVGYPCVFSDAGIELVTPTGAALLTQITARTDDLPAFVPLSIGYGAGSYIRKDGVPNLLRMIRAKTMDKPPAPQTIAVLETELDDLNPELFSHLYDLFLKHPAVFDFFTTPIFMKKNRPGTLITILTSPDSITELANLLMRESGSLGVRYRLQKRLILPRSEQIVQSPWGPIRIKLAQFKEGEVHLKPEYEDCHAIAVKNGLPLLDVYSVVQGLLNR